MSHSIIRVLFEGRLVKWAKAKSPALRVARQNEEFEGLVDETYFRAFTLPAAVDSIDLAGAHRAYTGVFQVTIVTPTGKGTFAGDRLTEELSALFPLNDRMTKDGLTVQIMTPIEPGPHQQENSASTLPVSFEYRADTT
jgi:hypothetical protein